MQKGKILHISEKLSLSSEWSLTEASQETKGPDLVPTSDKISSGGKVNALSADKQAEGAESSSTKRGDIVVSNRTGDLGYIEDIDNRGRMSVRGEDGGLTRRMPKAEFDEIWRAATDEEISNSDWATKRK